jgi:hypothetical protein
VFFGVKQVHEQTTVEESTHLSERPAAIHQQPEWRVSGTTLVALLVCAIVPAAIHLMFGVDDVGLVEEWGVLHRFDQIGPVFWTPSDGPLLASQGIRPLTVAPHSLAYVLDPDSFRWYHLIQAFSLSLKALAMWALLSRLRFHRATCFAGGITFALFPAWDSLFTFRTIHIQVAMAAVVAAMALLLAFAERPTWPRGLAMVTALTLSVLHYEAVYAVIALAPLLLLARPRLPRSRLLTVLSVWYIIPFLNGLRILRLLGSDTPLYQEAIITDAPRDPISEIGALTKMVLRGGTTSWVDPPFGFGVTAWSILLGAGVVTTFVVVALDPLGARRSNAAGVENPVDGERSDAVDPTADGVGPSPRSLIVMTAASLGLAMPVVLVFWVQPILLKDPLRVFSVASIPLTRGVVTARTDPSGRMETSVAHLWQRFAHQRHVVSGRPTNRMERAINDGGERPRGGTRCGAGSRQPGRSRDPGP